jgi:NAD(P)-dependent dehydrogenase (short-subunit alcohol dehydrogenase family)
VEVVARKARSLAGKVVVITGGARGIGAATARALIAEGARVAIGDLDEELAKRTAKELDGGPRANESLAGGGGDTFAMHLDVTDHAGYTAFLDEVEREVGQIDVLINNAGIMPLSLLDEESDSTSAHVLAINLGAVIHGTREAMQRMKPRRSGHIVNVASLAGKLGVPGAATYCATKHGVVGLSEAVHFELRGTGVDVTCVMPTIVRTELAAGLKETKLSSQVGPEDVAAAILSALHRPRLDVYVPGYLGRVNNVVRVFPRRVGEFIGRTTKTDQLLSSAMHSPERAAYEARVAASAPGGDSGR